MLLGAILAAFGIVALAFQSGFHYKSTDRGPSEGTTKVTATQEKVVSISPVVSGLALAGGISIMILAARK